MAAACGWTIRLTPPTKARRRIWTSKSSRSSSRSTRQTPTNSSQLAPVPPLTPRTAPPWGLSSDIWIYPPTCPAWMLAGAFPYNAASPVPTSRPWPVAVTYLPAGLTQYVLNKFSKKSPPYNATQDDVRFDSSPKIRSRKDHRTPIGSRSRWGHHCDVRDALDGSL